MVYNVTLTSIAEKDIEIAAEWYADIAKHLHSKFIDELRIAFLKLAQHPHNYKYYDERFRILSLNRFPYIIYFHIHSAQVIVVAVLHYKQNEMKILHKRRI